MKSHIGKIIGKSIAIALIAIVALVVVVISALYIPFVQTLAKDFVIDKVNAGGAMHISLDKLHLHFPLDIELHELTLETPPGDTMVTARSIEADISLMSLLRGRINVNSLRLVDGYYAMGTLDSTIYLRARINSLRADGIGTGFSFSDIDLDGALLDGANITMVLKDTITPKKNDTTKADPLRINIGKIELQNVAYMMHMLPTIDTLNTFVSSAALIDGIIDTGNQTIDVGELSVDSTTVEYLTPSAEFLKTYISPSKQATGSLSSAKPSAPWTINARKLRFTSPSIIYAMSDATPAPGLDFNYISLSNVALAIDSFFNRGSELRVPLTMLEASERCGLQLKASALLAMDSTKMTVRDADISTLFSSLHASGTMGLGDLAKDKSLPVQLTAEANIGMTDVVAAFPSLRPIVRDVPLSQGLTLNADINGTSGQLNIYNLEAFMPRLMTLQAQGQIDNPFDFNTMSGSVEIDGELNDVSGIKNGVLPAKLAKQINIPHTSINGVVDYSPGLVDGTLQLKVPGGELAADAHWQQRAEGYKASLTAKSFPLQKIMPSLGIADISTEANIYGSGYDPAKRSTKAHADIELGSITYNGHLLRDISLNARLDTCVLTADILSRNSSANMSANLSAHFIDKNLLWNIEGNILNLDLHSLGLSANAMGGRVSLSSTGGYDTDNGYINAHLEADNLVWNMDSQRITAPHIDLNFATDSTTAAHLASEDLILDFIADTPLDSLLNRFTSLSAIIDSAINSKSLDVVALQHTLPGMEANLSGSNNNFASRYLKSMADISFSQLSASIDNDSTIGLKAYISGLKKGSTKIDTITFDARSVGPHLVYHAAVNNKRGTMDEFAHVKLDGFIAADKLSAMLNQHNIDNQQGFRIGVNADFDDTLVSVRFVPHKPVIAYKPWTINDDNFVSYNFVNRHIDANLSLSSDSSSLKLFTVHPADSTAHADEQEDVTLKIDNIRIEDWLSISPFAPPVKGRIDSDMSFHWDTRELTGQGNIAITDLYYNRERVGTFNLGLDVRNSASGALNADVALLVDGQKVITANGALNDSTARNPFLLDFSMIQFPLRVVNPFLSKNVAQLSGMLNGKMEITGDLAHPVFNGSINFDSTAVKVGITGASYRFSPTPIPVDSNIVSFNRFSILGLNENPLYINGTVNASRLSDIAVDLSMNASDMMIVNSDRPRGADIYGKAYIDLDATVKGNMQFMAVNANLNVLGGTNITYVMSPAQTGAITGRKEEQMVRFVQFSDTTQVAEADSITSSPLAIKLDAQLIISEGSTINVDLSADGKNRASLQGAGHFTYSQTPMSDGRLTGRLNINKGFVRYSVPVIGEKNFTFEEGSNVVFTGDMLNPTLNIHAIDKLKANVTQTGQNSRLVNFNVILAVTNTLNNLNVAFDLQTNDDITIENELATMSPDQRANQAMNLLLYNTYTGPGTKASSSLSGNPLFSFLTSQVNSWAANNIRGVDVSFGIDQYQSTTDGVKSTTTSYSYKVSKSLFNDRFKIVVGGNYSTDADADENFAQNLINDISFEYMLNRSGSMYIRLFRHVGFESILEGEVTQTGVGFVLKRKLNSLRDIFRFATPKKEDDEVK